MSEDETKKILGYLKAVLSLLQWLGAGSIIAALGVIGVVVADHYDLIHLKKDVDWIKPKVEYIWYKYSFPIKNEIS